MRLLCVISHLLPGGAEKVMATVANHFASLGYEVTITTLVGTTTPSAYPLAKSIALVLPGRAPRRLANSSIRRLQALVRLHFLGSQTSPDAVLVFGSLTNLFTLIALPRLAGRTIVAERSDPVAQQLSWAARTMRAIAYRWAGLIAIQSRYAGSYFKGFGLHPIALLRNPIKLPSSSREPAAESRLIVAVGRLIASKGYDVLLQAFAIAAPRIPGWHLRIVGAGPELPRLTAMVQGLGLGDSIEFTGFRADPASDYEQAGIFVISSRHEGFPNALCEAMAMALPVIATNCPGGVTELIDHRHNGLLVAVDDVEGMAHALTELAESAELRRRLGREAKLSLDRGFAADSVLASWLATVVEVSDCSRPII